MNIRLLAASLFLFLTAILPQAYAAETEPAPATEPVPFVVQLTRPAENYGHRRVFMQIDKVLNDLGDNNLKIVVVAYEDGIHALLEENEATSQFLTKLANRGVTFRACRISMRAWDLTEEDFPLEVEFVPAGAPEMVRLQMQGYKYWRP